MEKMCILNIISVWGTGVHARRAHST